ncbi:MAG: TetR/AcrR family transcriptional regulator [Aquabacterium sp.]
MQPPADTRTRLLQAAMTEFIEAGFAGTDTNRIARRAGFAPQTFYRWFDDKTAIFIEVLRVWEEVEWALLRSVIETQDIDPMQMAEACVESIRPFLTFRRNLRTVLASVPDIRAVRQEGRQRLLAALAQSNPKLDRETLGSLIVQFEQLCDAIAQGELTDLGLSGAIAMQDLAGLVMRLRAG